MAVASTVTGRSARAALTATLWMIPPAGRRGAFVAESRYSLSKQRIVGCGNSGRRTVSTSRPDKRYLALSSLWRCKCRCIMAREVR